VPGVTTAKTVAVLGGTGKTGRSVCRALEGRGAVARPLGRSALDDLGQALDGADAAYLIAPNMHPDEPALVGQVLAACRDAAVGQVVHHSVAAPYAPAMPHHLGKAVSEDLVRRSGLAWTVLQPCAYVQNFVPALAGSRVLEAAYDVDALFGLVDLEDVGEAAATVLLDDGHVGATYELGGPRLVSLRDVAAAAEAVTSRPVELRRITAEEFRADVDERTRDWLLRMFDYYDRHGLPTGPLPLRALLGRAATGLEETLRRELARD
jgi:uncharacterized protein YbjT (DUF2867 family)